MLTLQPMTAEEYASYKAWVVEDYAREIASNQRISMEEARASSLRDIERALGQGLATPNHFLYHILRVEGAIETRLGYLWIEVDPQKKRCFIFDIFLQPEFRRQGWGRQVLELLETQMKQQGIRRIGLHVFGNNTIAQDLYRKLGYVPFRTERVSAALSIVFLEKPRPRE